MTKSTRRDIGGTDCLVDVPVKPVARLVLAHGAGAPMDSDFMETMAALLCERNIEVIRFEFPYMANRRTTGRKAPPNRQPVLLETWQTLMNALAEEGGPPLCIGGKSMGGRMATVAMAEQPHEAVSAVVCLGYPFHPPGKPDKLRTGHLAQVSAPLLIVQGSRDAMGNKEEVERYGLPRQVQLEWLDLANHDLKPLKKSGFSHADYLVKTADLIADFVPKH